MRQEDLDPVILDAGDLFFSTLELNDSNRVSEQFRANAILKGYEKIGCDAINVGQYELSAGLEFLLESGGSLEYCKKTYGSVERWVYDSIGDIIGAIICAAIVVF